MFDLHSTAYFFETGNSATGTLAIIEAIEENHLEGSYSRWDSESDDGSNHCSASWSQYCYELERLN